MRSFFCPCTPRPLSLRCSFSASPFIFLMSIDVSTTTSASTAPPSAAAFFFAAISAFLASASDKALAALPPFALGSGRASFTSLTFLGPFLGPSSSESESLSELSSGGTQPGARPSLALSAAASVLRCLTIASLSRSIRASAVSPLQYLCIASSFFFSAAITSLCFLFMPASGSTGVSVAFTFLTLIIFSDWMGLLGLFETAPPLGLSSSAGARPSLAASSALDMRWNTVASSVFALGFSFSSPSSSSEEDSSLPPPAPSSSLLFALISLCSSVCALRISSSSMFAINILFPDPRPPPPPLPFPLSLPIVFAITLYTPKRSWTAWTVTLDRTR
mmetsp:Transcript_33340/g.73460  ORF Transcript_33340/g.73460 Transcript_33340/m.73460 type:complete len:333 (+) Transcript_33340:198-1196(+)